MTEPRCSLCGKSVFSGAILWRVTDRSGATVLACRAWCGEAPAPVMSVERLEEVRRAAAVGTPLERELLAEIDLAARLVRRAEMDKYEAAGRAPDWVQHVEHIVVELSGGRVLDATGTDWQEWWDNGTIADAIESEADTQTYLLGVETFDLSLSYVDARGIRWAHKGDWQYGEPLMRRVDEHGYVTAQLAQVDWEFLGDLRTHHGPLVSVQPAKHANEAPA